MTPPNDHVDVLIVGAGLSGIGAAYHLQTSCPEHSYAIVEGRDAIGGTWDLFRYPGIRSDSDMYTLGFSFKPWTDPQAIADGPAIRRYIEETAEEYGIDRHITFGQMVEKAEWSTESAMWTLTLHDRATGTRYSRTASFVFMCSGYYSYKGGYTPEFAGRDDFAGPIVHPQQWPEDLDYVGKNVVVIGSGATAVTLVPAMAETAGHVTMLQRTPTYMVSRPRIDPQAERIKRLLPPRLAHRLIRRRKIRFTDRIYKLTRRHPERMKQFMIGAVREELGPGYDVDTHFTPPYDPWDQRLCLVPDGDLFEALRQGTASVVTSSIDRFTTDGIQLDNGDHLDADVIVTATGLQLVTIGDMDFVIDGEQLDFARTFTYKGLAYSGVPNLISTFGYINASWTLGADLVAEYGCRLLNHMRATGSHICVPRLRPDDAAMAERPWIDSFTSGYMQRAMSFMPRQGDREPWVNTQNYMVDRKLLGRARVDDGVMTFSSR